MTAPRTHPSERIQRVAERDIHAKLAELLGPRYVRYREAWNRAGPASIPEFPVHLDLELFDNCNQRCTFCPRNTDVHTGLPYEINTNARIDEELVARLVEQAGAGGLHSVNLGAFAEPLLTKSVLDVVRRFHDAGVVDSRIITNGLLLHRFFDPLVDSGLVQLFVSIDAAREPTYAAQRGPGFERVRDNVLRFLEHRSKRNSPLPIVRVSFVVTDANRGELDEFLAFWSGVVDFVDVQTRTDYRVDALTGQRARAFDCIDPFRRVAVLGNGDILPCCTFWGRTLAIGNARADSIADAWRGERMRAVRENLLADRSAVCVSCQSP